MAEIAGSCRWVKKPWEGVGLIEIDGQEYRVELTQNAAGEITAISCGEYRVMTGERPGDRWRCSCPDWTYRRQHTDKGCKHTAALRAALRALEKECHQLPM